jgi:predicted nucleic acid-binding Zn ribbon protein
MKWKDPCETCITAAICSDACNDKYNYETRSKPIFYTILTIMIYVVTGIVTVLPMLFLWEWKSNEYPTKILIVIWAIICIWINDMLCEWARKKYLRPRLKGGSILDYV